MRGDELEFLRARAKKIERTLARNSWTRVRLASATGYDERTIRNVLAGKPVRDQTIIDICQALGIAPELDEESQYAEVADEQYGSYARRLFSAYDGGFFAYRRSFTSASHLMRTVIEFAWSEEAKSLTFSEHSRYSTVRKVVDHSQTGHVYISPLTDLVHLLTTHQGAVRLITLSKMRGGEDVMRGAVLTQSEHRMYYQPSVSAIVLTKISNYEPERHRAMVGPIDANAEEHGSIVTELDQTERDVVQHRRGDAYGRPLAVV